MNFGSMTVVASATVIIEIDSQEGLLPMNT